MRNTREFWNLGYLPRLRIKDRLVHPFAHRIWPACISLDRASRDDLSKIQQQRLTALVVHAVRTVPFYRRWQSESGFELGDKLDITDLPIVGKEQMRRSITDFQSTEISPRASSWTRTSGSSGQPLRFTKTRVAADHSYCALWRGLVRYGVRPGMRRLYMWGHSGSFNSTRSQRMTLAAKTAARDWLNNSFTADAYLLGEKELAATVRRIRNTRPTYVHGYASAIYELARYIHDTEPQLDGWEPLLVVTESEKLFSFQRQMMESVFRCAVAEQYGSVEMGHIAGDDLAGRLRVNDDVVLVEMETAGGCVLTNLASYGFPFIRYRQGDSIELAGEFGDPLPYSTIAQIHGRVVDTFVGTDGGRVHGVALAHTIDPHLAFVHKYEIRQSKPGAVDVKLITNRPIPDVASTQIKRDIRGLMGRELAVTIERVDEIPPDPSGKFRWVRSDVNG